MSAALWPEEAGGRGEVHGVDRGALDVVSAAPRAPRAYARMRQVPYRVAPHGHGQQQEQVCHIFKQFF